MEINLEQNDEMEKKQEPSQGKPEEEEDWQASPEEVFNFIVETQFKPMPDFPPITLTGPSVDVNSVLSEKVQTSGLKLHFTQTQFTQAPEKLTQVHLYHRT